jgi:hypothetical protein
MTTRLRIALLLTVGIAVLAPGGACLAEEPSPTADPSATPDTAPDPITETVRRRGDLVSVFGETLHVPANVEQWGDIVSIGGEVIVEGRVRGSVIVISGDLSASGEVRDDLIGVLSNLNLDGAEVGNQLVNVAGTLRKESTDVGGQQFNMGFGEGKITLSRWFGVLGAFLFWVRILGLLAVFVVVLLLAAMVPERVRRISDETPNRIFAAFFVGLLGYLAYWILLLLLLPTVLGFFLVLVIFFVMKWLGIAGMFHWLGQRVGRGVGREMSLLGAVLIGFVPYALLVLAPSAFGLAGVVISCIFSLLIWIFLEIPAVGLFLLTRAGGPPRRLPNLETPGPAATPSAQTAVQPSDPPAAERDPGPGDPPAAGREGEPGDDTRQPEG